MSRRQSNELEFGSDSFLDVICNLVGIMIILIIVAGLRVSRAPVSLADSEPAPDVPVDLAVETDPQRAGINTAVLADWLEHAPADPTETPAPAAEAPPTELISRAEQLRSQLSLYAQRQAELQARETAAHQTRSLTEEQLKQLVEQLRTAQSQAEASQESASAAAVAVQQLETQSAALSIEASALAQRPTEAQVLKHSVTPLSRQISEKDELHFRLSGNHVAVVPMDSLAEALKSRMERSRDLFLRVNRYEGTAGPVEGFLMRYVIEKQPPSAIEELRNGGPYMRIQMTYYELEATPDVVAETAEQALKPGSRFVRALARARPGNSLTFWVYPDSFDLHRTLQEFAHEARFDVAARPLPVGVPIAGSPHGSRSSAQ